MSAYGSHRSWSDRYIPEICRIVGPLLLVPATVELDNKEATDLMVFAVKTFGVKDMRIAARVRRPGMRRHEKYGPEFTIRSNRALTGAKTEWAKILEGFGDWLFYGHASAIEQEKIEWWMVVCLSSLREHHEKNWQQVLNAGAIEEDRQNRGDGTAFHILRPTHFPPQPPLIVASNIEGLS